LCRMIRRATTRRQGARRWPGRHPWNRRLGIEVLEVRALPSCMVSLVPSEGPPQLVGERITWAATATDCGTAPVYQFSVAPQGGDFHVVRDFSPANAFTCVPLQEGAYEVRVTAKDGFAATETTSDVVTYAVDSRVTGTDPVITPTANPLVALYS